MLSNLLIRKFIKNHTDTKNEKVRNSYGFLAGIVGLFTNIILFIIKFSVGLITSSISIMADAFNNLSDAASSLITIFGFKLSSMPADKEHPFGHGRIEYLSALIVAFMVMLVGVQFVKSSFEKILNPEPTQFEWVPFILLIISIFLKLWLSRFNKFIGEKINSSALKASSVDALGDVFTSTSVAISLLVSKFTSFPIDGYIGIIVALVIVYSGFSLVRETINPLLGEAPDPELVKDIESMMLSYDNIIGIHDLIVHNYGPGRIMASIHAEIPSNIDIMEIHHIIDTAEREISKKLNIYLVIHMDPICVDTDEIIEARNMVQDVLSKYEEVKSFHDFRVVGDHDKKNLIFDIEVCPKCLANESSSSQLLSNIEKDIKKKSPEYRCVITVDLAL